MVTWAPTHEWEIDKREVQLNQYSTAFLKVWISMMFYKSSKWLYRAYWDFVWEDWNFSKEKYEKCLDWVIEWIRNRDINIPEEINVEWILETDIETFSDETWVSQAIGDFYREDWVDSDTSKKVKEWIKKYYEEQMLELTWYSVPVRASMSEIRELVDEIVWWLQLN